MRPSYLLLLLLLLNSCGGTTRPAEGSRIVLETDAISRQEFFLMSVRDTAVVVSPYATEYFHIDGAIASSIVVPMHQIRFLEQPGGNIGPVLGATGAGLVSGAYIGNGVRPLTAEEQANATREFRFTNETYIGMISGGLLGALVGYFAIYQKPHTFDLGRPEERAKLKHLAIYRGEEPPELARIR